MPVDTGKTGVPCSGIGGSARMAGHNNNKWGLYVLGGFALPDGGRRRGRGYVTDYAGAGDKKEQPPEAGQYDGDAAPPGLESAVFYATSSLVDYARSRAM